MIIRLRVGKKIRRIKREQRMLLGQSSSRFSNILFEISNIEGLQTNAHWSLKNNYFYLLKGLSSTLFIQGG